MNATASISTREVGSKTLVDIQAENLDFRNCESIKSAVHTLVTGGQTDIVLNLATVNFMDSSGLGILLYCKRACHEVGGSFGVTSLQEYVHNLLALTNLNQAIAIFKDEDEIAAHT